MNTIKTAAALLLLATASLAGEMPNAPSADRQQKLFSRENVAAFTLNLAVRTTDSVLTCRTLAAGGRELVNPTQSCGANAALIMSAVPLQIGAVWFFQRTHHNKLARIAAWGIPAGDVPAVLYTATHAAGR